jgi:predicted phosphodiesterase
MRIKDFGDLGDKILVFGGPYSNLRATQALRGLARKDGYDPSAIICTGDVVAYCANPVETVREIRDWGVHVIAGNCEDQLASGAMDCGCGFEEGSACDLLSGSWYPFAKSALSEEVHHWMGGLPQLATATVGPHRVAFVHAVANQNNKFVFPSERDDIFLQYFKDIEGFVGAVDVVFCGHSGIAFDRKLGRKHWVNAGVIGMPPHNGTSATQYVSYDIENRLQHHWLEYDAKAESADMRAKGLVQGYDTALLSGFWPSEDVLPQELRVLDKG